MKLSFRSSLAQQPPRQAAAEWLDRQAEGTLSSDDQARLDAWLAADPAHREAYEEVSRLYELSDEFASASNIMTLRHAALAAAPARNAPARGIAVAASIALAVVISWTTLSSVANAPTATPMAITRLAEALGAKTNPASAVYRTRVGERLTFILPDHSVATLNTNSILRVAYVDGERGVRLLQGQAIFEVAKNRQVPFRVYAGDRKITALGTVFDVRFDGGKVKVTLVEGAVRVAPAVSSPSATEPAQQVDMVAGEILEAPRAAPMVVAAADVRRAVTWKAGVVEFAGEPLSEAVAEMNRYTEHRIEIADPSIAALRVSGVFRTGETDLFARMISQVVPVDIERNSDGRTLLKERRG